MRYIKRFRLVESSEIQFVELNSIRVPKYKISSLNRLIGDYLNSVYGQFGWFYAAQKEIVIPGFGVVYSDYIDLLINNYTIFKKIIYTNNITNADDFIQLVTNNLDKFYHYTSKFFVENSLPIVINTKRKGNYGEKLALDSFQKLIFSRGFNIQIMKPTIQEDVNGVDAKFELDGKIYTIQVKPMSKFEIVDDLIIIDSPGALTLNKYGVMPDYLFFYSQNRDLLFLKNIGIYSRGSLFESPLKNLISEN